MNALSWIETGIGGIPPAGAVLVAAILAGLGAWLAVLTRRLARQRERLHGLRADVESLCAGAAGVDERQNRLERGLRRVGGKLELVELRDPGERPYTQAIRMVHRGAGSEELVRNCGLARGEAELIAILHRVDKAG
jgi:hypothetical protein